MEKNTITVFLKDITQDEIEEKIQENFPGKKIIYLSHTDFFGRREEQFKTLKKIRSEYFLIGTYNINYLQWSYVFLAMSMITKSPNKFIIDTTNQILKINIPFFITETFRSLISVFYQLFSLFTIPYYVLSLKKKHFQTINEFQNKNIAYLRTTDSFNLTSGGSLGHTIGVLQGFKKEAGNVIYYGIDNIKSIDFIEKVIVPPKKILNNISLFNRFLYSFRFKNKIQKLLLKNKTDIIYQRLSLDNITGVLLSKSIGVPLIIEFNSFSEWGLRGNENFTGRFFMLFSKILETITLKNADLIVTVSEVLKDQLVAKGFEPKKITVAFNGVDTEKFKTNTFSDKKNKLGISKNDVVIGFCGTFGGWHGIDILTGAIKLVLKKKVRCTFLLIGDGLLRNKMEQEFNHFDNVIFTKQIPYNYVVDYLSVCDILLSPHSSAKGEKFIGSPTKLFEYMSMGKIIIASNLDQINDIINPFIGYDEIKDHSTQLKDKGQVGIKVSQGETVQLANSIISVVKRKDSLSFLGQNARIKAINHYTWDSTVKKIMNG